MVVGIGYLSFCIVKKEQKWNLQSSKAKDLDPGFFQVFSSRGIKVQSGLRQTIKAETVQGLQG
jgi:hypothetical protein